MVFDVRGRVTCGKSRYDVPDTISAVFSVVQLNRKDSVPRIPKPRKHNCQATNFTYRFHVLPETVGTSKLQLSNKTEQMSTKYVNNKT